MNFLFDSSNIIGNDNNLLCRFNLDVYARRVRPFFKYTKKLNINYRLFIGIPNVRELGTYNNGNKLGTG